MRDPAIIVSEMVMLRVSSASAGFESRLVALGQQTSVLKIPGVDASCFESSSEQTRDPERSPNPRPEHRPAIESG